MSIDDTLTDAPVAPARPTAAVPGAVGSAGTSGALLSTSGLDVGYGPVQVLFNVDFDVQRGEMVALLGTNGAGKSTLLKAVCGLMKPKRGAIRFGGNEITGQSADKVARTGISLMPGGKGVFPTLTVAENLRLAGWLIRREHKRLREAKAQVEELFPILRERAGQLAGDLSGGEQQMLALGMALTTKPELLLIDELSLGLAPTVVGQLLEVVQEIHRRGTTIVIVEQSVNVALELAERAVFMEKGEVRFEGRAVELLERPDILRSVFIAGASGVAGGDEPDQPTEATQSVASDAEALADRRAGRAAALADAPEVLHCSEVLKRFGGIRAVDGATVTVRQGEIVGLIGHNGAGKTTLLDCISGFHEIDAGRIVLRGVDVTEWAPHERARGGLGRSFQDALLFPTLTVEETVAVARERHLGCRDMLAEALRLPASYESELGVWTKVDELVELMGLDAYREKLTGELSTGTRRIVDLACILAQEPSVLLLDEPSAGVAQKETEALGPLLLRVRDHTDCAIVVVEHDMPLLQHICDHMVALELGAVIAEGPPAEVLEHPAVIESYLGTSEVAIARSGSRAVAGDEAEAAADPARSQWDAPAGDRSARDGAAADRLVGHDPEAAAIGVGASVAGVGHDGAAPEWVEPAAGAHQAHWGTEVPPPDRPRRGEPATDDPASRRAATNGDSRPPASVAAAAAAAPAKATAKTARRSASAKAAGGGARAAAPRKATARKATARKATPSVRASGSTGTAAKGARKATGKAAGSSPARKSAGRAGAKGKQPPK
ncbi:MAG TPA: ATP-binding cassette domain-containing protein [Acidimicrobiales bacterium]|nr:ATP-binding cassette domain-containing protein [Acidimicrobiales bacterium]